MLDNKPNSIGNIQTERALKKMSTIKIIMCFKDSFWGSKSGRGKIQIKCLLVAA